jgi:hypothetical protein
MVAAIPVIVGMQLLLQALALDIAESRTFPRLRPLSSGRVEWPATEK